MFSSFSFYSYNDKLQGVYYHNKITKTTQWEHPLDEEYKTIVNKARKKIIEDKSEDFSQIDSGIKSLQGNEDSGIDLQNSKSKMDGPSRFLVPLDRKSTSPQILQPLDTLKRQIGLKNIPPPTSQIGLSMNPLTALKPTGASQGATPKGYTLTGSGSMFLKSNSKRIDGTQSHPIDDSGSVKGILRDSSLSDVRGRFNQETSFDFDDRKSVRFKLDDKKLDIKFDAKELDVPKKRESSEESNSDEQSEEGWDFSDNKDTSYVIKLAVQGKNSMKPPIPGKNLLRAISTENEGEKSRFFGMDKKTEQQKPNVVKPLYDESDSDSDPSSVRSFPDKVKDSNLAGFKEKISLEQKDEEEKIRTEMRKNLEKIKKEIIEKNKADIDIFELEVLKSGNKEEMEKMILNEKKTFNIELSEVLEKKKRDNEDQLTKESENLKIKFNEKLLVLQKQHEKNIQEAIKFMERKIENLKIDLEKENSKEIDDLRGVLIKKFEGKKKEILTEHRSAEEVLQKNHAEILEELERDLKTEEELLKKEHLTNLAQLRDKLSHELDLEKNRMRETGEDRLYEKIRCEKRLLEDKYRCLKEKYIRLKTDVKLSLERRNNRRREQQISLTTGSETERSKSNGDNNKSGQIDYGRPPTAPLTPKLQGRHAGSSGTPEASRPSNQSKDKKFGAAAKYLKHVQQYDDTSISQSDTTISNNYNKFQYIPGNLGDNGNSDSEAIKVSRNQEIFSSNNHNNNNNLSYKDTPGRQRKKIFTRMKSASTSRLNSTNKQREQQERSCTPVENLRRQLQKLEDLEDQFPDNSLDTTYHLRYPFSDAVSNNHKGSSELEFFKHRIHLERDSVRRAKESLRTQRTNFRARQREIKQRHKNSARHTLDQLILEEKELTEMEVNLHRTRALLGEKVIRLRHLEQSLQRVYEKEKPIEFTSDDNRHIVVNKDDATISDLSSHSSSGFSSTDFASDTNHTNVNRHKEMYQESSEIIQSLENLNAEIREIWEILSKQQSHGEFLLSRFRWKI